MILVLALIITIAQCQGLAWPDIQTGKVTPITTFSGVQGVSTFSTFIQHNDTNVTGHKASLALISYNCLLSTRFAFNTTILSLNSTNLTFQITTYNSTYFNILSYHYLISSHPTIEINNLCYYTSTLYTGSGTRNITNNNATTSFNGSFLVLPTVFTGFKVQNT